MIPPAAAAVRFGAFCFSFAILGTPCHAKLRTATRNWPFSVLGFWDKNTGFAPAPCHIAGIFQPLPGSRNFKLKILPAILFLAWLPDARRRVILEYTSTLYSVDVDAFR